MEWSLPLANFRSHFHPMQAVKIWAEIYQYKTDVCYFQGGSIIHVIPYDLYHYFTFIPGELVRAFKEVSIGFFLLPLQQPTLHTPCPIWNEFIATTQGVPMPSLAILYSPPHTLLSPILLCLVLTDPPPILLTIIPYPSHLLSSSVPSLPRVVQNMISCILHTLAIIMLKIILG